MASPVNQSQAGSARQKFGERFERLRRLGFSGSSLVRGFALFGALLAFTVLYAFALQFLSRPDEDVTSPQTARPPAAEPVAFRRLDDAPAGPAADGFGYSGSWQHIKNAHDGRSNGTSSRAYRVGATASFAFTGRRLELYGVKGPNGGYAELRIDGDTYGLLRFYAPHKEAGTVVYRSPLLAAGRHAVTIIVAAAPGGLPKRRFVNLDGAAYSQN